MKTTLWVVPLVLVLALMCPAQAPATDASLKSALDRYDRAFKEKDVATVKSLLAPEVLLYEHSVRNDGLQDVFENHLKPEILEDLQVELSDVRLTAGADLALVTRQYRVHGKLGERTIDSKGNETLAWKKISGEWKVVHIHYSHPCPRPPAKQ